MCAKLAGSIGQMTIKQKSIRDKICTSKIKNILKNFTQELLIYPNPNEDISPFKLRGRMINVQLNKNAFNQKKNFQKEKPGSMENTADNDIALYRVVTVLARVIMLNT